MNSTILIKTQYLYRDYVLHSLRLLIRMTPQSE